MRIVKTAAGMRRLAGRWRREGVAVGFVPTMGYLHEGHLSLMRRAREAMGRNGKVVVSIYVNPTQFGPEEDFRSYPRDLERDRHLCRNAGVDVLFVPDDGEIYFGRAGEPSSSTFVVEEELSRRMEGASRPDHFRGVITVVAKLLQIVRPDAAVFGAKDFQQAAVVRRMTRDLHFPVRMMIAPTVRERDGLALSSRNKYLGEEGRKQAVVLWRCIQRARAAVRSGSEPIPAKKLKAALEVFIGTYSAARVDYVEIFDPVTLEPVRLASRGTRLALAVFIGKTRLIDNGKL